MSNQTENPPDTLIARPIRAAFSLQETGLGMIMALFVAGALIAAHEGFPTLSTGFICLQIQWAIIVTLRVKLMADERADAMLTARKEGAQ